MTNWQTGDVITAEKLNDLESRAGGGSLEVIFSRTDQGETYTCNHTFSEIQEHISNGGSVTGHYYSIINGSVVVYRPIIDIFISPIAPGSNYYTAKFTGTAVDTQGPDLYTCVFILNNENDQVEFAEYAYSLTEDENYFDD